MLYIALLLLLRFFLLQKKAVILFCVLVLNMCVDKACLIYLPLQRCVFPRHPNAWKMPSKKSSLKNKNACQSGVEIGSRALESGLSPSTISALGTFLFPLLFLQLFVQAFHSTNIDFGEWKFKFEKWLGNHDSFIISFLYTCDFHIKYS